MSEKPKRIQRKRTKGWKMPEGAIYVGRPSKWGNPFHIGQSADGVNWYIFGPGIPYRKFGSEETARAAVIHEYRAWMLRYLDYFRENGLDELRGKDLACWCALDKSCHADILLELANGGES